MSCHTVVIVDDGRTLTREMIDRMRTELADLSNGPHPDITVVSPAFKELAEQRFDEAYLPKMSQFEAGILGDTGRMPNRADRRAEERRMRRR